MRGIRSLVVAALVLSVGCGGKAAPPPAAPSAQVAPTTEPPPSAPITVDLDALPAIPSTPQAAPPSLMAAATVGNAIAWLVDLATYANAVRPGIGMVLTPDLLLQQLLMQGIDLRGADLAQPIHALVLDPREHANPLVIAVAVSDESALRAAATNLGQSVVVHGTWAAIGTPDALRAAAPYALTTAVTTAVPRELTVTIDVARVQPFLATWIDALTSAAAPTARAQVQKTLDALAQIERIVLTVTGDRDRATLTTALTPRADTSIARFAAQQRPAAFGVVERLAAAPVVFGGRVDHTVLFASLLDEWKQQMAAQFGGDVAVTGGALFTAWPTMMTDEHAMSVAKTTAGVTVSALWNTAVGAKVQTMVLDYIVSLAGPKATVKPKRTTYRGVSQTFIDLAGTAAAAQVKAASDALGVRMSAPAKSFAIVVGPDGDAALRAITDAVMPPKGRKAPPVTPGLVPVLTAARARGDSYVIAADLPALAAMNDPTLKVPPSLEHAAVTFGFSGTTIVLRTTLPASQFAAVMP